MTTDKERQQLNDAIRQLSHANRVDWRPSPSRDPNDQKQDRADLNAAIRRAAGRAVDDQDGGDHE